MAARTSSRQIAAREQARERAAAYVAREQELVQLAEAFFLADGEADDIRRNAQARIAAIQEQAHHDVESTRAKAAQVVEQMLATGTPITQVADRLGVSVGELRRARTTAATRGRGDAVVEAEADAAPQTAALATAGA